MELIDLSKIPHSDDRFARFLDDVCQSLEFDHASYATFNPISGAIQGFANYRADWIMHYTRKGLHRIDPTIHIGRKSIAPVDWSRLERTPHFQSVSMMHRPLVWPPGASPCLFAAPMEMLG